MANNKETEPATPKRIPKKGWWILAAAAGVGAGWAIAKFLSSEKGKEFLAKFRDRERRAREDLAEALLSSLPALPEDLTQLRNLLSQLEKGPLALYRQLVPETWKTWPEEKEWEVGGVGEEAPLLVDPIRDKFGRVRSLRELTLPKGARVPLVARFQIREGEKFREIPRELITYGAFF